MVTGKEICKILKEIRKEIAKANNIKLTIPACTFKGECIGTCIQCDSELNYLTRCLHEMKERGQPVYFYKDKEFRPKFSIIEETSQYGVETTIIIKQYEIQKRRQDSELHSSVSTQARVLCGDLPCEGWEWKDSVPETHLLQQAESLAD